jgi:hypothetical protein
LGRPDGIYIAFGAVAPPVLQGTDDENRRRVAEYASSVQISPVIKVHLGRERAEELAGLLLSTIAQYDAQADAATQQAVSRG